MVKPRRILTRMAAVLSVMGLTGGALAEEVSRGDADFQKGLALGAALTWQPDGVAPAEDPAVEQLPGSAWQGGVETNNAAYREPGGGAEPTGAAGYALNGHGHRNVQAPQRAYSLADAIEEMLWRRKVAAELRQRFQ